MPRFRLPGPYACAQACARILSYFNALIAIVVLGYILREWPSYSAALAAGLLGSGVALITDSWEVVSILDPTRPEPRRPPGSPLKRLVLDVLVLGICVGSIIMMLFSDLNVESYTVPFDSDDDDTMNAPTVDGQDPDDVLAGDGSGYTRGQMTRAAIWILTALVVWRFIFALWACWDRAREIRNIVGRPRRRRQQMQQA